jgi:diacylglycerol kinase (ATP)
MGRRWRRSPKDRRQDRDGAEPTSAVEIVVTPGSGEGRAARTAQRLSRRLARRGREPRLRSFRGLGPLQRWASELQPGPSHIICIGGDGTLSAAAPAAMRTGIPFVPVPNGFGNVFAGVFGFPDRAEAVEALLETGQVRRVDVGVVASSRDGEVFLSHRSFGVLEQIQTAAERKRQQPRNRLLRYLWYYRFAWDFAFRERLSGFAVEVDGQLVTDDAVLITVANVEAYRGFLPLTPAASPIDGLFDVAIIPRTSKAALARQLVCLLLQLPGRWDGMRLHRGRRVVVTTPRRREELRVSRRALPLLVPAGAIAELTRRTVEEAEALPDLQEPGRKSA